MKMLTKIRTTSNLLKTAKKLSSKIRIEKSDSLRLDCLNNLGIHTTTIQVGNTFSRWVAGISRDILKFPYDNVYNVKIIELKPAFGEIRDAVQRQENEFVVDFKKCLQKEMIRLEVQYRMEDDFLRTIVHDRSSPEPLGEETKYHLSAQLTDPPSLTKGFSEVDIEEYPVTARIYVKENIDTVVPGLNDFKAIRRIENEMLSDYDPRHGVKILKLQKQRYVLRQKILQENPQEALRTLLALLRPTKFQSYLRLEEDFRMHRCVWGSEKLEMSGLIILPENIEVITRTDLSIEKPTARGILHYQVGQFSRDIEKAFSKK
jgi:hypothetical protein